MTEQTFEYNDRINVINKTFIKKMNKLFEPHKHHVKNNSVDLYLAEITQILNDKLPVAQNQEHLVNMLRSVWSKVTAKPRSRFFFNLDEVASAASQVSKEHYNKFVAPFEPKTVYADKKETMRVGNKAVPETQGWTVTNCQAHIAETQRLMDSGELPRHLGEKLILIPKTALRRLQEQGN